MSILTPTRLLVFGASLPFRKLSVFPRRNWPHSKGILTLASIGINTETETGAIDIATELPRRKKNPKKPNNKTTIPKFEKASGPFATPKSFSDLGLPSGLISRLEAEGFASPTDVQSASIPAILSGRDAVIQSYTGSGKTLAYLLPILARIGPLADGPERTTMDVEAVIVAPSRELGMQIVREVEKLLGPEGKRAVQQLVGGANKTRQEEALKKNKPAIVVGTPGRIAEISSSGRLHTHGCKFLVLDEVDELLSFQFREHMHRILEHVGKKPALARPGGSGPDPRQTVLVSASVPFSVVRAARSWGHDPVLVRAGSVVSLDSVTAPQPGPAKPDLSSSETSSALGPTVASLPPNLKHYYCVARAHHKIDALRRCMHALDAKSVIVFMNHTRRLKDAVFKLEARGVAAAELHGDLGKLGRSTTLRRFKAGELRVLVTNELSARGLDVAGCDLVVNLDLPTDPTHYAHRAGRAGRLGRPGTVVTMCEESEVFVVKKVQKKLDVAIPACEFVDGKLVLSKED